jgi:putative transposase
VTSRRHVRTRHVLLDAHRAAAPSDTAPVVLADARVENVNAQVDELIHTGVRRRLLAFTELKCSTSMIEAWWRSLKKQTASCETCASVDAAA